MPALISEHEVFTDSGGQPIVGGSIFIGTQNLDPVTNAISIFSDRALTSSLANPQTTNSFGQSTNKIWIPGRFSLVVKDANSVIRYTDLDRGENPATGTTQLINVLGTNTITADASPNITALVNAQLYVFIPAVTNTGATTLKIDSTTVKNVKVNGSALTGGELPAGLISIVAFNETNDNFDMTVQVNTSALGLGTTDNVEFAGITGTTVAGGMIATQAEQETGTAIDHIVTPGRQHFHQSSAKVWGKANGTGTVVLDGSYNVTSFADFAVGRYTWTWADDFSAADAHSLVPSAGITSTTSMTLDIVSFAAGSSGFDVYATTSGTRTDTDRICIQGFGDQ